MNLKPIQDQIVETLIVPGESCKAQYLGNFDMLSNFGVSPPNFTYSNIRGGIGITGAMSSSITPWYTVEETEEEEIK